MLRGVVRRWGAMLIVAVAALVGIGLAASGGNAGIDRALAPLRFAALAHPPTGGVVVVEMDAASAAAIRRWPWSRANYAAVVDRLRAAGAASVVFDVDFSSPFEDAAGDRAFAAALARSPGLVALPTFAQDAGSGDARTIDALPLPMLRPHVALASVSVTPDPDGQIRSMPFATMTDGVPRPSLSAFIAARAGRSDATFPIDMAIDPAAIPRLSFVAVRDGRFDPAAVRGRHVLIGATAVEMGDRYGVPRRGVIPGVIVQALAAETLLAGIPVERDATLPLALAIALVAALTRARRTAGIVSAALVAAGVLIAAALVQQAILVHWPLAAALATLVAGTIGCLVRRALAKWERQRLVDDATGLPNLRALQTTTSISGTALAVCHLDGFDSLSAVLGADHSADLVRRVAERLALVAASPVYRVADRQLAWLVPVADLDDAFAGLRLAMLRPIEIAGRQVDVPATVGVATGEDLGALVAEAAIAADEARRADRFWQWAATDHDDLARGVSLMGELDDAIASGAVEVHYQPKCRVSDGTVAGVEALVRWRDPKRGMIRPDLFIPIAERTNRIAPLTLAVLRQVIADAARWRRTHGHVTVAINVSAKLLSDATFNAEVEAMLADGPVPTSALVFEVTESAAMSDPERAVAALRRYRALGVAVSMDDYGTGRSTLTYLRMLPLTELKIDRSFVTDVHRNDDDAVLVASTIALAHDLGLKVVAEGVEEQACLDHLRAAGCDLVQGWLTGRPMPLDELLSRLDVEMTNLAA